MEYYNKTLNKTVTASSKEDAIKVMAFDINRINPSTKALYEAMNEGSFENYYRTDDNFKDFMNTTVLDEVETVIRSDRYLIQQCIERRVKSHSIVWNALFRIFQFVKKSQGLSATVDSQKMKNWFAFNNTDYKMALEPIVKYLDEDLRPQLREEMKEREESK